MALAISSAIAINDSTSSYSVAVTGKLSSGNEVIFEMFVGGVLVSSVSTFGTSATLSGVTATEIYTNANGKSLTNGVTVYAYELNGIGEIIQSASRSGNITINARLSSLVYSTANPYNLDSITNIIASWTRPHTAFRARVTIYVNGVWCFSRYGFGTNCSFDPNDYAGYVTNMVNAMGGVSPREIKMVVQTQFNANTIVDLSGGLLESTGKTVTKLFVEKSTLLTFNAFTIASALASIGYSVDVNSGGVTHDLELKFGTTSILTRTGLTGAEVSIVPTAGEITAMFNATGSVNSITATLILTTKYGGVAIGTDSRTALATVDATVKPNFTTVTHSEATVSPDVATLIGAYVQGISSLNLAITGAVAGTGSAIKSYKITVEAKEINAVSGMSNVIVGSGTIVITGRVTDNRDRYLEKTVNVTVLAYQQPKINRFVLSRTDATGTPDPLGEYIEFDIDVSVSSLINGVEKNTLKYILDTAIHGSSYTNKATVNHTSVSFVDDSIVYSGYLIENSYDGRVTIQDKFFTVLATLTIPTGVVIMSWDKVGVGIGKIRQAGALDVGVDDDNISIMASGEVYSETKQVMTRYDFHGLADFDSIDPTALEAGRIYTFNTAYQPSNRPSVSNYFVGTINVANATQKYTMVHAIGTGGSIFIRYHNGTSWGSWETIWTSLNDGAGSGLDSDKLDGQEGSYYLDWNNFTNKPNNFVLLWSGLIDAAAETGTLSESYANFDFLIVTGFMDNASSENMVSVVIPVGTISTNARRYSLNHSFTASSVSWLNFSLPSTTQIRCDSVAGAYVESIRYVYGVNIE